MVVSGSRTMLGLPGRPRRNPIYLGVMDRHLESAAAAALFILQGGTLGLPYSYICSSTPNEVRNVCLRLPQNRQADRDDAREWHYYLVRSRERERSSSGARPARIGDCQKMTDGLGELKKTKNGTNQ